MKLGSLLFALSIATVTATASPVDEPLAESRRAFLAARTALADGRYQDALTLYRKVLEIVPDDPIVHLEYAQLLRDLNVPDEATRQAREAVRLDPEPRRGAGACSGRWSSRPRTRTLRGCRPPSRSCRPPTAWRPTTSARP